MPPNRSKTIRAPAARHAVKRYPLQNLERIQPTYFFTPDLEREINELEGITQARVLTTGAEIDEIHVISPHDRVPKKLVRDIESLLLVRFGIRIDHRRISVVQAGPAASLPPAPGRPMIEKVEKSAETDGPVSVQVRAGEIVIIGTGRARPGESELHAASRAVVDAVERMLHVEALLELQHVETLTIREHQIVLTVLTWSLAGYGEVLTGTSITRADPLEAAARATLDALNRKLVRRQLALPTGGHVIGL